MERTFDESQIKRRLRQISIITLVVIAILSALIFLSYQSVKLIFESSYEHKIHTESNEIVQTLKREIYTDIYALNTLSIFVKDGKFIASSLASQAISESPFDVISFFNPDGSCIRLTQDGQIINNYFSKIPLTLQKAIIHSFEGRSSISDPFFPEDNSEPLIAITTPIRHNHEIIGVLSGTKALSNLNRVLARASIQYTDLNSILLTKEGKILSLGNISLLKNISDLNIDEIALFNEEGKKQLLAALNTPLASNFSFKYNENTYIFHINPLGINDWYLITLEQVKIGDTPGYSALIALIYILAFVLLCGILSAAFGYVLLRKNYTTQLKLASYDQLTGTFNLFKLHTELKKLNYKNNKYGLIALNIRDFHYLNKIAGELRANNILKVIVKSAREFSQIIYICRTGVDQFYFFTDLNTYEEISTLIKALTKRIDSNLTLFSLQLPVVFYCGVAISNQFDDEESLIHKVNFTQKQVSKSYTHQIAFYDDNTFNHEQFIKYIESQMQQALQNHEFKLYLQPKVNLKKDEVVAAEAVVRWQKPDGTLIYPGDFIPIFEENGFCINLDLFVFTQICKQLKEWQEQKIRPINISINQSMILLLRKDYIYTISEIIKQYDIDPQFITIEILESLAAQNINELINCINNIHSLGLKVALDDFGSGYSSLNVLSQINIDELKFDKNFLTEKEDKKFALNKVILKHMVDLAQSLNIVSVAEGCENIETIQFLKSINCDVAQGFYFDKPLPLTEFVDKYLKNK